MRIEVEVEEVVGDFTAPGAGEDAGRRLTLRHGGLGVELGHLGGHPDGSRRRRPRRRQRLTVVDGCGPDFEERTTWARWLAVRTDARTALKWAAVDDVALRDVLAMTPTLRRAITSV